MREKFLRNNERDFLRNKIRKISSEIKLEKLK
jgi:hypothetical protein